jgi:formyl-CoA transferase
LQNLRILDLSSALAGPFCTLHLGAFGAEIIEVEKPGKGDLARQRSPYMSSTGINFDAPEPNDLSLNVLNRYRNKKSITLNLKTLKGKKILFELARISDVLVENFSPGTTDRLGISYKDIRAINPRIIYASISGFGQEGPRRNLKAYDPMAQALSGIMSITGLPEGPPIRIGFSIVDFISALYAEIGILLALNYRDKTGIGQRIEVAMLDSIMSCIADDMFDVFARYGFPIKTGNFMPRVAPFGIYKTKDGSYLCLSAMSNKEVRRLFEAIGRKELVSDERFSTFSQRLKNVVVLNELIEDWTMGLKRSDALAILDENNIISCPVRSVVEALEDPCLTERKAIVPLEHPLFGKTEKAMGSGMPIKFSQTPCEMFSPAPLLGQHNEEIYGSLLNYDDNDIRKLREEEII